jgi:hypothetical protein
MDISVIRPRPECYLSQHLLLFRFIWGLRAVGDDPYPFHRVLSAGCLYGLDRNLQIA